MQTTCMQRMPGHTLDALKSALRPGPGSKGAITSTARHPRHTLACTTRPARQAPSGRVPACRCIAGAHPSARRGCLRRSSKHHEQRRCTLAAVLCTQSCWSHAAQERAREPSIAPHRREAAWLARACALTQTPHAHALLNVLSGSANLGSGAARQASGAQRDLARSTGRAGGLAACPAPGVHLRALSFHDPGMLRGTTSRCAPQARRCP